MGYVHVYTGDGKGKTTAAIGIAMRAVGAGKKVFLAQFVKGMRYSELISLSKIPEITVKQFGLDCFIYESPKQIDIDKAREGLDLIRNIITTNKYQMIILDEANIALYYKLFSIDELLEVIESRHEDIEVIITGRKAPDKLIDYADLVTEMKEIKHYYQKGVHARKGIES
ncbi:MAG: cob(I)yrinic acid a,c-diamide adenosyltransferase [Candidatus Muiribacterium halophilum]|uniref:Cob(I)yrinic acid a,c-diamide adenosyltransferase n=1 Tax=Muiribacterium halophilum TaxID=2053465 RepID=A0A2N5ZI49_MUIH1|nr:MAG: cob(I)yrinic acid a,c-diamide adenosyltransferase [Candidatus Muirbacterium halophilum]